MPCDLRKPVQSLRISGRSKDDLDPFVHYQLHDFIELGVHQRYVDAERFVGRLPAFADMFPQCFGMHGACSQQAQSAGVAYGRGQPPAAAPHHAALNDRVFDSEESVDSVHSRRFIRCDQRYADFGVSATLLPVPKKRTARKSRPPDNMLRMRRLHAEGERSDRIVHYTGDTQQQHTGSTERQAQTGSPIAAEGRDGVFAGVMNMALTTSR